MPWVEDRITLKVIVTRDVSSEQEIVVTGDEYAPEDILLPRNKIKIKYLDRQSGAALVTMTEHMAVEKGLV